MECGIEMARERTKWDDVISVLITVIVLVFSYAALLENGVWYSIAGFIFGFVFLFYINGQGFDKFYIHIGDKIKIGGKAVETQEQDAEESGFVAPEYKDE